MKEAAKKLAAAHSGKINIAAYTALIIFVANLLINHGEEKAGHHYCIEALEQESDRADETDGKLDKCLVRKFDLANPR